MNSFPGSIKVRIVNPNMPAWYATSVMAKATPEKTVQHLNKLAQKRGIAATYSLATQEEYDAYKAAQRG